MATISTTAAPDVSSFLAFLKWGSLIGKALATFGWTQNSDTSQVVWPASRIAITACSSAAGISTYTYTTPILFGNAVAVGSQMVITAMTNAGNNGTFRIRTLPTGNTFTVANGAPGANESGSTGIGNANVSMTITNVAGNGVTATYTYTTNSVLFSAPNGLHAGMSIAVTGCTTGGFNITGTILTATATTFTLTNSTNTTEAETTAFGDVTAISALPGASTTVFEIWKSADTLTSTLPIIMKWEYGETAATVSAASFITVGTATDGAGTINSAGTSGRLQSGGTVATTNDTNAYACDFSGANNRFQCAMFHTDGSANGPRTAFMFSVERAHDSSGNDLGTYFTIATMVASSGTSTASGFPKQVSIPTAGAATASESFWGVVVPNAASTGSFGASTLVSPVFPMVGAVGNPLLGVMVGRVGDFGDNVLVPITLYGTSHTYLTMGPTAPVYRGVAPQCIQGTTTNLNYAILMRFE